MAEITTSNYPGSLDDINSLLNDQSNNTSFVLNGDHNNSITTITTTSTITGISAPNYILIDSELIHFGWISGADFMGCTRGADGTVAASHDNGADIYHVPVANWANQIRKAIIATQTELGINPSGDYSNLVERLDVLKAPSGSELTISAGVLTVTGLKTHFLIDTEGDASTDDLVTISGGAADDLLLLSPASESRTIVLKDGSGNIRTGGYGDVSLDAMDKWALLRYNNVLWFLLATSAVKGSDQYCMVSISSGQSISNATYEAISWNSETSDTPGWHDLVTNPERITVDVDGVFLITANIRFGANATGYREIAISKNGTKERYDSRNAQSAGWTNLTISGVFELSSGDYLEVEVYQTSGGSLNVNNPYTHFEVARLAN